MRRSAGKQAEAWRQRVGILQKTYVEGIVALDAVAKETFGAPFKALSEDRQDKALETLERREKGGAGGDGPALPDLNSKRALAGCKPLMLLMAVSCFLKV